jgi:hypothetical protein
MRFTIRDLLWLTVVVALGVAWVNSRFQLRELWYAKEMLQREVELLAAERDIERTARLELIDMMPKGSAPSNNTPKD